MLKTLTGYHHAYQQTIHVYIPQNGPVAVVAKVIDNLNTSLGGSVYEEKICFKTFFENLGFVQLFTETHCWHIRDMNDLDLSFFESEKPFLRHITSIEPANYYVSKYFVPHRFSDDFLTKIGAKMTSVSRDVGREKTGIPFQYLNRRIILDPASRAEDIEEVSNWLMWRRLQEE